MALFTYQKFIKRQDLRDNLDTLYVYGDNVYKEGYGGQAAEMRDESNAVGVPTKRAPCSHSPYCYLNDYDLENASINEAIRSPLTTLTHWLESGGKVVWPADGIGTGRAQLAERAPRIHELIENYRRSLEERFG